MRMASAGGEGEQETPPRHRVRRSVRRGAVLAFGIAGGAGSPTFQAMWIFAGCCVIALVLWNELSRIGRVLQLIAIIFERTGNRAAERAGESPVLTPEDLSDLP